MLPVQAQQARKQAAVLQQELAGAAPALEAATRAEAEAGAAFADMVGSLLGQAGALRGRLEAAHAAAEAAPGSMRALDLVMPDLANLASRVRALFCVVAGAQLMRSYVFSCVLMSATTDSS